MSRSRILRTIRSGNNDYVPVQPTPPWREEDEQRWARWERMSYKPQSPQSEIPAPEPEPATEPVPATAAEPSPPPSPVPLTETFEALYNLLGKYLGCSDHQRTILALWIVHTYCPEIFTFTPYLNIWSPEGQSGKTTCMKLLRLLCKNSWMPAGGLTAARLMDQIARRRPTLLLDDWHTAFRPTEAQSIIGFLNAGSAEEATYTARGADELDIYCPKAFAGPASLPDSLAGRSIPIVIQRCKPSEVRAPFCAAVVRGHSGVLVEQIPRSITDNYEALYRHLTDLFFSDLPGFSPRQRECALPLLTVARALGGKWPRRARLALMRAFGIYTGSDLSFALQLLHDIRAFFLTGKERIFNAELLEYLNGLDGRPWSRDRKGKPIHPNTLRNHLRDLDICPSYNQWINKQERKGFSRDDFVEAWERYLPAAPAAGNSGVIKPSPEVVETASAVVESGFEVVETTLGVVEKPSELVENNTEVVDNSHYV